MSRPLCRMAMLAVALVGLSQGTAQAGLITYVAELTGAAEEPPNDSPGTGRTRVDYDDTAHTLRVRVRFEDLTAGVTVAHIHSPTAVPLTGLAGVATTVPTFPDFPSGVTSGTYDRTFDLTLASSFNPAFITNNGGTVASAEAALAQGLAQGRAYLNVHTSAFPGGEIRGFLVAIPEPSTVALLAAGGPALLVLARRRRTARAQG